MGMIMLQDEKWQPGFHTIHNKMMVLYSQIPDICNIDGVLSF